MKVLFDRDHLEFTDEGTAEVLEIAKTVKDGPRVRVTSAFCSTCGEDVLATAAGAVIFDGEPDVVIDLTNEQIEALRGAGAFEAGVVKGAPFTVAADVVRILAQQWHTDDCPGPILFATEPLAVPS